MGIAHVASFTRVTRVLGVLGAASLAGAVGCVETEAPPIIPNQVEVSYGPRIYLVDLSLGANTPTPTGNVCTKFGVRTSSAAQIFPVDGFGSEPIDPTEPHNCFVPVAVPDAGVGTLLVDQVEVTNDLFQLCVDSDVCRRPDPSDASKSQVCTDEDDFGRCPVATVPFDEAKELCTFIGRRLPTMVEHILIRQAGFVDPMNPQPAQMAPYISGGTEPPGLCADARLNSTSCNATRPAPVGPAEAPVGSAENDVVMASDGPVYDLAGSLREWSSDGVVLNRGAAEGLPWFCIRGLDQPATCPDAFNDPESPEACVYGEYQPEGLPFGTYPVCVTNRDLSFPGNIGILAGGGIQDTTVNERTVGVFTRRALDREDDAPQRAFGFRCVDDRPLDANGMRMPFNNLLADVFFQP